MRVMDNLPAPDVAERGPAIREHYEYKLECARGYPYRMHTTEGGQVGCEKRTQCDAFCASENTAGVSQPRYRCVLDATHPRGRACMPRCSRDTGCDLVIHLRTRPFGVVWRSPVARSFAFTRERWAEQPSPADAKYFSL